MPRISCVVVIVLLTISTAAAAATDPPAIEPAPYELVEVSPAVVVAVNGNGSNLVCVDAGDGLVFFDTGLSTSTAARFRAEMESRFHRSAKALVLTHAHIDHFFAMGAFADVPVWAEESGRPRWERYLAIEWNEQAIASFTAVFPGFPEAVPEARLRMPTNWFTDELEIGTDELPISVRRTGGHTIDSSSATVGGSALVIAGDLVQARRRPYFGEPDTDFPAWVDTLKTWEADGATRICPGHGPVIDGAELAVMRAWFEAAEKAMITRKADGATFDEVMADDRLPEGYWPAEDALPGWWPYCLKRLYDAS